MLFQKYIKKYFLKYPRFILISAPRFIPMSAYPIRTSVPIRQQIKVIIKKLCFYLSIRFGYALCFQYCTMLMSPINFVIIYLLLN